MTTPLQISNDGIAGETHRRTLHFFWLVDESGSMGGQKIQAVNYAIRNVLPEIRKIEDNERVSILMRAIKFGNSANWHVGPEPVPVKSFIWNDMDARGGSTSTAQAIELLNRELALEKIGRKSVPPVIILLSDGYCTDSDDRYNQAIAELDKLPWGIKAVRVAIGIGPDGNYNKSQLDMFITPYLRKHEHLETLPAPDVRRLIEFIKVVSTQAASASASSKSDLHDSNPTPVQLDSASLKPGDGPSTGKYDNLDPNAVF